MEGYNQNLLENNIVKLAEGSQLDTPLNKFKAEKQRSNWHVKSRNIIPLNWTFIINDLEFGGIGRWPPANYKMMTIMT